jgi:hypothetical protein
MANRITTLDPGYVAGDLSVFPQARDDFVTLYEARNNAQTVLAQGAAYNATYFVVDDTSLFPPQGLLKLGPLVGPGLGEQVYYGAKNLNQFLNLQRGFAGSRISPWPAGTPVGNSVLAEEHNALKDAVIQIEADLGLATDPLATSLNGILTQLEVRFLSPKPLFRAYPLSGVPPLTVKFQNFSSGQSLRFLWDFGDGGTSTEAAPVHTYLGEGNFTVKLNMQTTTGAQGFVIKSNYITVNASEFTPFFYVLPSQGYSIKTAADRSARGMPTNPTTFSFVDQSDGDILQRFWIFDDSTTESQPNPDIHTTSHVYQQPGVYNPSLLLVYSTQQQKRAFVSNEIVVL